MRCSLLLIVLSVACCPDNTIADDLDLAKLLEIAVRFVVLNLKRAGNLTLTESTNITLPDSIKNISIGSVKLDNAYIYGFENLDIKTLTGINLSASDGSTKTNLCANFIISLLGVSTIYDADIGILNEIPIYGNGEINLAASKIDLDLCLNINTEQDFSVLYVEDLSLQLKLHDSASYITGFWKNDEVSDFLTLVISVLEQLVCMFISYENECFSCVASEVVQYVINSILPNDDTGDLKIDCTCLEAAFDNKYILQDKLEKLVRSSIKGTTYFLSDKEIEDARELLEEIFEYILTILRNKGLTL